MNTDRLTMYVDTETTGTRSIEINDYVNANIKVPANYTKPESIAKYRQDAIENQKPWADTALRPHFGELTVVAVAINGDEPEVLSCGDDEVQLLNTFVEFVKQTQESHNRRLPLWVGFNLMFDLRYLWTRCLVRGVSLRGVQLHQDAKPWDTKNTLDLRYVLTCGEMKHGTLKDWSMALGLGIDDDDIDGADAPKAWTVEALRPRVMEHCYRDVVRCQMIHERLKGMGL